MSTPPLVPQVPPAPDQPRLTADPRPPQLPPPGRSGSDAQRPRRLWPWLILLVVLVAAGFASVHWWPQIHSQVFGAAKPPATQPARALPVITATARLGDLPIYLNGLGTATAFSTATVRTRVDGQIVKIAFAEGQMVHEGDLLAAIDPRPYQVQLTEAQGQLAKDEASLKNARLDLNRYQTAREAVSQQQLDTAAATVAQFEGAVKTDQGQIDSANLQLTYCQITAPISGRIGLRTVDQGNMVHASDANGLAVITQLQPIAVVFNLREDDLPQALQASTSGPALTVEAYNHDSKIRLATGTLAAIDNQIDPGTLTVRLKAVFANQDQGLFPNQAVNIRLLVDTKKNAVLVPTAAIQLSPQQTSFVYVVKADQTVEVRPITAGPGEGDQVAVERGLEAGEAVVTDGVDKLTPGMKVTLRQADTRPTRSGGSGRPGRGTAESAPATRGER